MFACNILPIIFIIVQIEAQLTWKQIKPGLVANNPPSRRDHALAYDGVRNRLLLFGGRDGSAFFDDTWAFDLSSNNWTQITTLVQPEKRFSMVYGISQDGFYISTGEGPGKALYDDIWKFNLTSNIWTKLNPTGKKPGTIYGAAGGFYTNSSNKFFLTHGFSTDLRYANTLVYDIITNQWVEVFEDKSSYSFGHPNARCLHSGTMVAEDELIIYGGCASGGQTGGPCPAFDSWLFSESKQSWSHLEDCASPRTYSSVALLPQVRGQKRLVLYGGSESNSQILSVEKADKDQLAVLNVNSEEWSLRKSVGDMPQKRVGTAMISHPKGIFMFGGFDLSNNVYLNDLYVLEGDTTSSDNTPKHSQTCQKPFGGILNLIMLHGIFMVIGWGILLQSGAFIARYFRENKPPMWFHIHRACQVSGLVFAFAGFICAVISVRFDHFKFAHGGLGLVIMIVGLAQPLNALIRPHPTNDDGVKTTKRKIWELFHINLGRLALLLAVVNISLGIVLGQGREGHLIAWHVYVALFVIAYVVMETQSIIAKQNKIKQSSSSVEMS